MMMKCQMIHARSNFGIRFGWNGSMTTVHFLPFRGRPDENESTINLEGVQEMVSDISSFRIHFSAENNNRKTDVRCCCPRFVQADPNATYLMNWQLINRTEVHLQHNNNRNNSNNK